LPGGLSVRKECGDVRQREGRSGHRGKPRFYGGWVASGLRSRRNHRDALAGSWGALLPRNPWPNPPVPCTREKFFARACPGPGRAACTWPWWPWGSPRCTIPRARRSPGSWGIIQTGPPRGTRPFRISRSGPSCANSTRRIQVPSSSIPPGIRNAG